MSKPTCKHCGEHPEVVAGTNDNNSIVSDSCYGCRNRYLDAQKAAHRAMDALATIEVMLGSEPADPNGIQLADSFGRVRHELASATYRLQEAV